MDEKKLEVDAGLASEEAESRLKAYGCNEIQQGKSRPAWYLLLDQFKSPLVIILIFACILSSILGEYIEAAAIGAILFLNALIGFFQEYRAETAIHALREMTAPRAKVMRDGHQAVILAREVVPGDLLLLEAGDIVAADAAILDSSRLQINEAVLTGESLPVQKSISEKIFMGTSVATGTAMAKVDATAMNTELGRIAHLISTAQTEATPLQVQLARIGKSLLWICLCVVVIVAIIGSMQGRTWLEVLLFSVSLAVAAVPEGLPAIVTVALALGVQRMAAQNALIRKLPSVETLGSVSVICTDKTGTLTTGNMRVREVWGGEQKDVLRVGASCCDAELSESGNDGTGDPTEIAILVAAKEHGFDKAWIEVANPRVSSEPFDPERRRMSIFRQDGINYVKGGVESILELCVDDSDKLGLAAVAAADMSERGLRVLAVATTASSKEVDLKLIGLLGIADPPRAEAAKAIAESRRAGIIPIMITGDHPKTAVAIARELGLVVEGDPIDSRVHARATPEDKLKLVRKWKNEGHIVAMTGDGVNDAPALREAHVGIAMGKTGTEVTRQAADLILVDDNFATIVAAVREGRSIFQNIRKAVSYLLVGNLAEVVVVLGAIFFGLPLPLLAAHLLWINLVTDALPALTLIAEPLSPDIMKTPPRKRSESLLGLREWGEIFWIGVLEATVVLCLYFYLLRIHEEGYARSLIFTGFVFSQLLRSFGARSSTRLFWELGVFSNLWLLIIIFFTGLVQVSLHYIPLTQNMFDLHPLTLADIAFIMSFALIPVTTIEVKKVLMRWFGR